MDLAAVFTALAELAPAGRERVLDVTGGRAPVWLPDPHRAPGGFDLDRLAAIDVLHSDERLIRRGWGFLIGVTQVDGGRRRVRLALVSEPVRLRQAGNGYQIEAAGDLELTPLVEDPELAASLEATASAAIAQWGAGGTGDDGRTDPLTGGWLQQAAAAAGLPVQQVRSEPPDTEDELVGVARAALFVARDVFSGGLRDSLLNWAGRDGLAGTALAALYGAADSGAAGGADDDDALAGDHPADGAELPDPDGPVRSPLPLTAAQTQVVRRARIEPVSVVSGPPGNGKSHAVVAAALEVVDRGGSVLVATQSTHAADVLGELLERYPGPTPVRFGNAERRADVAAALSEGAGAGHGEQTLLADEQAVAAAAARVRQLSAAIDAALTAEQRAASFAGWRPLLAELQQDAPGAFARDADLAAAQALADRVDTPAESRWRRYRRRWARWRLRRRLGAGPSVAPERLRAAIEAGRSSQAADRLDSSGGTDLGDAWPVLHQAQAELAEAVGTAMRHRAGSAERWSGAARSSAAALATALRAGRNRRRQLLASLDGAALVRALPLWVGTAADTGDLLPPVPGLFDLVILDEASHLDQARAAPVLARARRALVVGDPRQLRFVSFVADVDVAATLRRHRLDDRVDIRRVSAFDLAAGSAPVTWLDEHFRSVPHLIEFSADRFYAGRITVATRHPANDARDAIEVVRVVGATVTDAVNAAEVDAVIATVRRLVADGVTGIAVLSPFRAQADALESALVDAFSVAELAQLGLRAGTVHAFQGSEAHAVVASLGLTDDDPPARTRFVADPHLFNVLVTRARERMVVVTSLTRADGVVGDYLAASEAGPQPPAPVETDHPWTAALAAELRRAGLPVRCDYPVGGWTVDVCLGAGPAAVGLVCRVHPGGVAVHRERQRSLSRAGWRLLDAFASRWAGDPVPAALELAAIHTGAGQPSPPLRST